MAASEADIAAQLIERLLADPAFRAEFRRDPANACRSAGLDSLADEMSLGAGKAMMTLDVRESKSSLAGVMMAAAMEGVGIYQFGEHILPHIEDVPHAVSDVLSRVNLPSVPLPEGGSLGGSPSLVDAPAEPNGVGGAADAAATGGGGGAGGGGAAAAAAAPPPAAAPDQAAAAGAGGKGAAAEAAAGKADKAPAVPPEQAAAQKAAQKIIQAESPATKNAEQAQQAAAKIAEEAKDLPSSSDLPSGGVAPAQIEEVGPGGAKVPDAAPDAAAQPAAAPPVQPAPAPPVQPAPAPPAPPVQPPPLPQAAAADVVAGTGGGSSAAAEELLKNKNLVLDASAKNDLRDGSLDPRLVDVLGKLVDKHKIEVSFSSDLNGRGLDIASVDGEPVDSGSPAARELASELADLKGSMRPSAVGTPFQIRAQGFVSDGAHQDRIHVAFDPPPLAAQDAAATPAPAAAPAAAPAPPVAPAAAPPAAAPVAAAATAAPPEPKPGASGQFMAVKADAAKAGKGSSGQFLAVKQDPPPQAQAAVVQQAAPAGGGVDLSAVSDVYPGDNASREQIAAWMGKLAEERGLPRELPVMASLVESGMKNLNFGDADSVGFYQMRVGIWNQGAYAGFPDKPELQVKWFLDQAESVKKARIAAGKSIDDPHQYGDWIADVERPAEQYRGRYQLRLDEAQGLLKNAPTGGGAANGAAVVQPAPAAVAPVDQAAAGGGGRGGGAVDPHQFGAEGTGGTVSPETDALLHNKNITFDADGISDLKAGRIDPRVVAVLTKLSHDHKLTISCMCSDHPKFTTGGSVSNHHFGRGVDIAAVDGVPVNSSNFDAREIAMELSHLNGDYRPDEIGSPWAISGPGYFTDAAHQNHLHIGFKQEISSDWKPTPDVAATGTAAPAAPAAPAAAAVPAQPGAVAAAAPGQPAAAAAVEPPRKVGDSQSFMAVPAHAAAAGGKGASGQFMALQPPAGPPHAVAAAGTAPAVVADAATATAAGGSSLGASALEVAKGELAKGVHETGYNTGADVDKYLAAAKVAPGNPWCASFVTWSLEQAGHKMPGSGWAAVATWVHNAEAGNDNLQVVSPDQARPGDLVAYDWGGGDDFGSDGHIGFLASNVQGDKFTALEGNNHDAVMSVPRQLGGGVNVKFIRVNGGAAPPPAAAAVQPAAPAPAAAAVQPAAAAVQAAPAAAAPVHHVDPGVAHGVRGDAAGIAQVDSILQANGGGGAGAKALAAITEAKRYIGTPYQWGGSTPQTGFDCSGLMQWAYAHAGVQLPRTTYDQVNVGEAVASQADLKPGDLIFFGDPKAPHHVAMSLGGDKFIHAPQTGEDVKISSLNDPYFKAEYAGARRVDLSGAASPVAAAASAPAAPAPPAAPAIDPTDVAKAHAAVARDAAEVRRGDSAMFMAVKAMETKKQHHATVMFMKAIDPSQQVKATAAAAPDPGAAAAPAAAPSAASDASMNQAVGAPVPANELDLANVGRIGDYPGDQAGQQMLAKWLGDQAEKAGLPRELPVMASLVESGLRNVKGGDADSAGFFQMRVGLWDKVPEYTGYRQNPNLQAKWFIDQALAVKRKAIQAGDVNFGKDPSSWGNWIADVERPAVQYRGRYQLRLDEARKLLR